MAFKQVQGEVPGSPIFAMKLAPQSRHLEVQLLCDQSAPAPLHFPTLSSFLYCHAALLAWPRFMRLEKTGRYIWRLTHNDVERYPKAVEHSPELQPKHDSHHNLEYADRTSPFPIESSSQRNVNIET